MKIDGGTGAALGLALILGFGIGYGVRMGTAPEEAPAAALQITHDGADPDPELATLQARVSEVEGELATARCALGSSGGINAYHDGDYGLAIQLYDEALKCDPDDGYVLSLKAYSLFKAGDLDAAISTQQASLEDQPEYAMGYFNLARFLCASGDFEAAATEVATAISLWPDVERIAAEDGEYQKLCQGRATP